MVPNHEADSCFLLAIPGYSCQTRRFGRKMQEVVGISGQGGSPNTHAADSRLGFPMFLWVGPGLITIYNDAYRDILGDKQPSALGARGRDVWGPAWDVFELLVEKLGIRVTRRIRQVFCRLAIRSRALPRSAPPKGELVSRPCGRRTGIHL